MKPSKIIRAMKQGREIRAQRAAILAQPRPRGSGPDIARLVQRDIEARAKVGQRKYGERLKSHNGRDALTDAYQEALDLCCYLRQEIAEREHIRSFIVGYRVTKNTQPKNAGRKIRK